MKSDDRAILRAIADTSVERGYPPTIRELCAELGHSSAGGMLTRLRRMRRDGLVDFRDGSSRTLHVTRDGIEAMLP